MLRAGAGGASVCGRGGRALYVVSGRGRRLVGGAPLRHDLRAHTSRAHAVGGAGRRLCPGICPSR